MSISSKVLGVVGDENKFGRLESGEVIIPPIRGLDRCYPWLTKRQPARLREGSIADRFEHRILREESG